MASYCYKSGHHYVIFRYVDDNGKSRQCWMQFDSEEKAKESKQLYTSYEKKKDELSREELRKIAKNRDGSNNGSPKVITFDEMSDKWLHRLSNERKAPVSPNTLDSYRRMLKLHVAPYFGSMFIRKIRTSHIEAFRRKLRNRNDVLVKPLAQSTVDKCLVVLNLILEKARAEKIIEIVPKIEKIRSRKSAQRKQNKNDSEIGPTWTREESKIFAKSVKDDYSAVCLAAELALLCSLRNGETVGITLDNICFENGYLRIRIIQQLQRINDADLRLAAKDEVIKMFPKTNNSCASSLLLMHTKNLESDRDVFVLREGIIKKIMHRLEEIYRFKKILGSDYIDNGLLFCFDNGRPMENNYISRAFKKLQRQYNIPEDQIIDFQGLRRSGQTQKVSVRPESPELTAKYGGHSRPVMFRHYNKFSDEDKLKFCRDIEDDLYGDD